MAKAISKMSDKELVEERRRLQKKTGLTFGRSDSSDKDSRRLATVFKEYMKRFKYGRG